MATSKQTQDKQVQRSGGRSVPRREDAANANAVAQEHREGQEVPIEGTGYAPWNVSQSALDDYKANHASSGCSGGNRTLLTCSFELQLSQLDRHM